MPKGAWHVVKIAGATRTPVSVVIEPRLASHRLCHVDVLCPSTPLA